MAHVYLVFVCNSAGEVSHQVVRKSRTSDGPVVLQGPSLAFCVKGMRFVFLGSAGTSERT